ncbi:prostaglandin G/H synthase 1 [Ornithorhynchus anatinus]|uniref:prostaglandin G/H synthase 1 n=1 Tax=Ornithorhynchus anatinus TaxID=9258 RepID=UPI0010A7EAE7|nr:prostaglandin G/H synthase 1 [Ornithorhynchus anatinus]
MSPKSGPGSGPQTLLPPSPRTIHSPGRCLPLPPPPGPARLHLRLLPSSMLLLLLLLLPLQPASAAHGPESPAAVNPCCYFPCQNKGVCVRFGLHHYECDCTRTGYHGRNCTSPEFWTWLRNALRPSPAFYHFILTHGRWFWNLINSTFIRDFLMRLVLTVRANLIPSPPTYNSAHGYISWEAYANVTYYTRVLPPVPDDCPTPMGVKGKKQLPDPGLLAERFLLRKAFVRDPQGTNLLFAFFAQHFTHQFFKTSGKMGRGFTKALGHGVDLGHVYGDTLERQHKLRLFKGGKLKYQVLNGEMYPPSVMETRANMTYPPGVPLHGQLAVGQEVFGLLPGLMVLATLWLREHNRVCDILQAEHPSWADEQLFQTARLILIGETIKIVIEDYVQHLSGYHLQLKFDPELLFGVQFQYRNRIAVEFNQLYHWHPLMPDSFVVGSREYSYEEFVFNTSMLLDYGVESLVDAFSRQPAGQIGGGENINRHILHVAIGVIEESRELRLQPFNEYRKRFGLKPYKSFQDLTGEQEKAAELQELYGDIDALEFYPGLLLEKCQPNSIFGESMVEIGAPFSLKGLLGNPICSPEYWKPSTFGGETGFNIVKTASLHKLVCANVKTCPYVAFHVPAPADGEGPREPSGEL